MTELREMTKEGLAVVMVMLANAIGEDDASRLFEHISALEARAERARDAALEEAAGICDAEHKENPLEIATAAGAADRIRALKSQPARRFVEAQALEDGARALINDGPNPVIASVFGPDSIHRAAIRDLLARFGLMVSP